jgi:hypothetical protein
MSTYAGVADRSVGERAGIAPIFADGFARLAGAPLDFIKTAAAFFMVLDHYNTIVLARGEVWLFRFGRIAMPLFCFAVAAHVVRSYASGREGTSRHTLQMLLIFAVVAQPFYSWAFQTIFGNVLFTLAAATAVAAFMPTLHPLVRHLVFAAALAAFWLFAQYTNAPSDYGYAGFFFPAAIALTLLSGLQYLPWVILYGASLNSIPQVATWDVLAGRAAPGWWVESAIDAGFVLIGSAIVIAVSLWFAGRPRFLSRYALHVFYPAHIGLLALLRTMLPH